MFRFVHIPLVLLSFCLLAIEAQAASSNWFVTDGARIRLVSQPSPDGSKILAGLQFELDKGWKTYWRNPGSSGLPPQIHFLGSQNVAETILSLPVPKWYAEDRSIGYKDAVTFPISVTPANRNLPVFLKVTGVVGVCGEICVPVQFELGLEQRIDGGNDINAARALFGIEKKIPSNPHANLNVQSSGWMAKTRKLQIEATVPEDASSLELFVEGPSSWYLSRAKLVEHGSTKALFEIDLSDISSTAEVIGTELRYTLIADGVGIDQRQKIAAR